VFLSSKSLFVQSDEPRAESRLLPSVRVSPFVCCSLPRIPRPLPALGWWAFPLVPLFLPAVLHLPGPLFLLPFPHQACCDIPVSGRLPKRRTNCSNTINFSIQVDHGSSSVSRQDNKLSPVGLFNSDASRSVRGPFPSPRTSAPPLFRSWEGAFVPPS